MAPEDPEDDGTPSWGWSAQPQPISTIPPSRTGRTAQGMPSVNPSAPPPSRSGQTTQGMPSVLPSSAAASRTGQTTHGMPAIRLADLQLLEPAVAMPGEFPAVVPVAVSVPVVSEALESVPPRLRGLSLAEFRVLELLARGGTGSVYRAQRGSGMYAVKVLRGEHASSVEAREALLREAQVLADLHHPNVAVLFGVGQESDEPFLVTEHVDGANFHELLTYPLRPPLDVSLTVIRDTLRALGYIHAVERPGHPQGVIHGDVSPQNLLVGLDGSTRLIDFGVAREPGRASHDSVVRCKPRYASPELLAGDPLSAESDIFAVGAMLYQVLTGRRLFHATDDARQLAQVTGALVAPPSEVHGDAPAAFDDVCLRALRKDRKHRFSEARLMLDALESAANEAGVIMGADRVASWLHRMARTAAPVELRDEQTAKLLQAGTPAKGGSSALQHDPRDADHPATSAGATDENKGGPLRATLLTLVTVALVLLVLYLPELVAFFGKHP